VSIVPSSAAAHGVFTSGAGTALQALVFDLDGTLVHSAADLMEGVRRTFREQGIGELPQNYAPKVLHGTMEGIMRAACKDMGWVEPAQWNAALARFVSLYAAMQSPTAHLYDGVRNAIDALARQGLKMGVCTNSSERSARLTLTKLGLFEHMAFICGADTFGISKPSPVPLHGVLHALGVAPEHCLYVGDTETDAQCAQAACVHFAWHTAGYGGLSAQHYPRVLAFEHWAQLQNFSEAALA